MLKIDKNGNVHQSPRHVREYIGNALRIYLNVKMPRSPGENDHVNVTKRPSFGTQFDDLAEWSDSDDENDDKNYQEFCHLLKLRMQLLSKVEVSRSMHQPLFCKGMAPRQDWCDRNKKRENLGRMHWPELSGSQNNASCKQIWRKQKQRTPDAESKQPSSTRQTDSSKGAERIVPAVKMQQLQQQDMVQLPVRTRNLHSLPGTRS